jgi:hypothetical protein
MTRHDNKTYPTVRSFCAMLTELTGTEPVLAVINPTTMVMTHSNDRVVMTTTWVRKIGSRKWHEGDVTLTVEGEDHPLAWSTEHYAAIFAGREDEFHDTKKTVLPALTEIPADRPMPIMVQQTYRLLTSQLADLPEVEVSTGMEGDRYALQYAGPVATVRVYFEAKGSTSTPLRLSRRDRRTPIRVVRGDGIEITQEVMADPSLRAALMSGDTSGIADLTPRMSGDTRGHRSNAVESRRAAVVRV